VSSRELDSYTDTSSPPDPPEKKLRQSVIHAAVSSMSQAARVKCVGPPLTYLARMAICLMRLGMMAWQSRRLSATSTRRPRSSRTTAPSPSHESAPPPGRALLSFSCPPTRASARSRLR
jgi:hypothetical protein